MRSTGYVNYTVHIYSIENAPVKYLASVEFGNPYPGVIGQLPEPTLQKQTSTVSNAASKPKPKRGTESEDEGVSDVDDHETKRIRLLAKLSADPNANDDDDEEEDDLQKPVASSEESMAVDDEAVSPVEQPDDASVAVESEDDVVVVAKSAPKILVMQKPAPSAVVVREEKNDESTTGGNKNVSPTKPKGKVASKKSAANVRQKLISSFFKK
ncbi:UNVERIFIED_CONTAM: hypothetical protein HDU68_008311 [Siphonaria sp. JEL0065]|nr:hypothetical protein HDU68_008311 [Siphonaria sp. JEL0065]